MPSDDTTRTKVQAIIRKHPSFSTEQIAKQVGVSGQRVRQLLESLGYEWRAEWRLRRGKQEAKPVAAEATEGASMEEPMEEPMEKPMEQAPPKCSP